MNLDPDPLYVGEPEPREERSGAVIVWMAGAFAVLVVVWLVTR